MSFVNKKLEEFNEYIRFRKVAALVWHHQSAEWQAYDTFRQSPMHVTECIILSRHP